MAVSVLWRNAVSGLSAVVCGYASVMLSEKKMKKDKELVLELETQIKGTHLQHQACHSYSPDAPKPSTSGCGDSTSGHRLTPTLLPGKSTLVAQFLTAVS